MAGCQVIVGVVSFVGLVYDISFPGIPGINGRIVIRLGELQFPQLPKESPARTNELHPKSWTQPTERVQCLCQNLVWK
jgi:hypothetical protein